MTEHSKKFQLLPTHLLYLPSIMGIVIVVATCPLSSATSKKHVPFAAHTMWFLLIGSIVATLLLIPLVLALYTLLLAFITLCRRRHDTHECTALYVGRVSHTRWIPVIHSFNYPLFMFAVDLDETVPLWNDKSSPQSLWPLSTIMSFRDEDHYKNGEGGGSDLSLTERTFNLVKEKTKGAFQPSQQTHRVVLVTHLCYYGYCFNPVSFFYILGRDNSMLDALILEVSNTPWNEMSCYVLHPDSVDVERVQHQPKQDSSIRYEFRKTFHVSPFMDMDHLYDWTFQDLSNNHIIINASMKKKNVLQFSARVDMQAVPISPLKCAWKLMQYPVYCAIIQVWIHIEAFWLFKKGVEYQPHPEGSETTASRMIASIMTPLFALKDKLQSMTKSRKED